MDFPFDDPIFAQISQVFYSIAYNDKMDSLHTMLLKFRDDSLFLITKSFRLNYHIFYLFLWFLQIISIEIAQFIGVKKV